MKKMLLFILIFTNDSTYLFKANIKSIVVNNEGVFLLTSAWRNNLVSQVWNRTERIYWHFYIIKLNRNY